MGIPSHALTSFVPALLARRVAASGRTPPQTGSEVVEVAVVGIDIADSTAMTQDLATRGPDGPERLAEVLNRAFAGLADAVVDQGGSVVALAGDEMVAVWPAAEHGGLAEATRRAAAATAQARERIATVPAEGGHELRTRTGVGTGLAYLLDIGREHGRRLFVAAGPALQEMEAAQHAVAPGEIGLGESVGALLGPSAVLERTAGGVSLLLRPAPGPDPLGDTSLPADTRPGVPDAVVARYLPQSVFHGLRSGGQLRAESAPVTVVFVTLRSGPWNNEACVQLGEAALHVMRTVENHDGTLVSARQDIDGLTLLVGFGLPPIVREHEATHAALSALEISSGLKGYMEHGIGIATGHAFCGVFGSVAYRQYTVVGPVVNLGARLMQHAQNEVLCDGVTQRLTRERLRFSARPSTEAKGIRGLVEVYRPEWHETDPGLPTLRRLAQRTREVTTRGRERERRELAGRLVALSLGTSTTVVVEGDPGSGKTHLAVDLLDASAGYGRIVTLVGGGDEMDRRPYHAFKPVLTQALGLAGVREADERAAAVQARLAKWPEVADWAPLLDDVLDLGLGQGALRDMTGIARRENTIRLAVQLLGDAADGVPLLLVLDDCHWMDSASWELLRAVHRQLSPLMIALFTRPLEDSGESRAGSEAAAAEEWPSRTAVEVGRYLREHDASWFRLAPLPVDVTEQIARDFLAVDSLDLPLRSLFREKVEGSPLFTVELAFQLRADHVISVERTGDGALGRLAVPVTDLASLRLPVRVEEVYRARLSGLTERQRAVIRAASVVGTSFDPERLLAADPDLDADSVEEDLRTLEHANVVETGRDGWRFQHTLVRDITLQSALPSELRARHRALATWYERNRLVPETFAIIARHWEAGGDPVRQVEYLESAGTSALLRGAEDEAVALTRAALVLDDEHAGALPVDDARRAFWHSQVGEALSAQNRLDEALVDLTTALDLLGRRVPRTRLAWTMRLLWEVLRQVAHLVPPVESWLTRRGNREASAQAAEVFGLLAEAQYFRSDSLAWTTSNLAAINLAERAGDVGVAGRAYSGLGNLVGTLRLHALARRYFRRARQDTPTSRHGTTSPLTLSVVPDLDWEHDITTTVSEAVYLRTMNRTTDVMPALDDVVERLREAGQNQPLEIALAVRGFLHSASGTLLAARADFEALVSSARRRANTDHLTWGLTLLTPVLLALDRKAEALRSDDQATEVYTESDRLSGPNYHGSHVQALVARGATGEALEHAERAMRSMGGTPVFFHLTGLTAMVEACLEVLETGEDPAERRAADRVAKRALRGLRGYVRLYPFGRGHYELCIGRYLACRGHRRRARRAWTRGIRSAEGAGLQLDAARLRMHLAAGLPEDSPERADLLRRAHRSLEDLGLAPAFADPHRRAA